MLNHYHYRPGDILRRPKALLAQHVGLALPNGVVFHNDPVKGECVVPFAEFANGQPVTAERKEFAPSEAEVRLRARVSSPQPYDLLTNNCEHTISSVLFGKSESPQLQALGAALFFGALVVALVKSTK